MSYKLIIFDLDGVIIDSEKSVTKCYLQACNDIFWDKPYPTIEEFLSHVWDSLTSMLAKLNISEIKDRYREYAFKYQNEIELFEDVKKLIIDLHNNWKIIALVTWKERDRTEKILKQFWLEKYFNQIVTSSDIKNSKPDPEWILKVINDQGISKAESIYIWDSTNDIMAAKNACIKIISVTWWMHKEDILRKLNPDFIVNNAEEIRNILGV